MRDPGGVLLKMLKLFEVICCGIYLHKVNSRSQNIKRLNTRLSSIKS